jgi:hypothetical protein
LPPSALEAAEKVNSKRLLVAQALLPVLVLLHLSSMLSQEWLCYSTFSAASSTAEVEFGCGSAALRWHSSKAATHNQIRFHPGDPNR